MNLFEPGILPESQIHFYEPNVVSRKIDLNVTRAGSFFCDQDYKVSRSTYDSYLLIYTTRAQGVIETGSKVYATKAGEFALIDCYNPHSYYALSRWDFLWVHFNGSLANAFYELIAKDNPRSFFVGEQMSIAQTMERLVKRVSSVQMQNREYADAIVVQQLLAILSELVVHSRAGENEPQISDTIQQALEYIHKNPTLPLTLSELSQRASFSQYHFIRLFHREVGMTPYDYIKTFRINLAKYYLRSSATPVKEIAAQCGFSESSNFIAAFRKMTGMTPAAYRQKRCNPFD